MDIVAVATKEIGYKEQGENRTKYGQWYGMNGAKWCHIFVSWCAAQAGISTSIIPKTASTDTGMNWFKKRGLFKYKGSYTPQRGDIVYFKTKRSHVGIVESSENGKLYTIEGNSGGCVRRRKYSLYEKTITGYGTPKYQERLLSSNSENDGFADSLQKNASEKEITYLRKLLEKKKPPAVIHAEVIKEVLTKNKLKIDVRIWNNAKQYCSVPVGDDMNLVLERCGTPGKLTFTTIAEKKFPFQEGNAVNLLVNGKPIFYGFIFTKNKTKENKIEVTAYDQLRYLKNKDLIIYKNKTVTEVITQIAKKFDLQVGELEDTKYRMTKVEENQTLFDVIQNALDETMMVTGQIYVLYDNSGRITLKNMKNMKVKDCVIDKETARDYTYKTTIDENVYNQILLVSYDKEKKTYHHFINKSQNNINKWGVLQYYERLDTPEIKIQKSKALMKLYNKKRRTLSISGVFGNSKVRAGSLVPVFLDLGDCKLKNFMLVEKVTHNFANCEHTMDLILSGGDFFA